MSKDRTLTAERLRELLDYDPATGVFTRKMSTGNQVKVGDVAGTIMLNGYRKISHENRSYYAHRLVWLFVHGVWPTVHLDHVNGDRDDNRIINLREADHAMNNQNLRRPGVNNTSGFLGVSFNKRRKGWIAQIAVDRRRMFLGCFDTPEEASAAYLAAKAELHPFWAGSHNG